MSKEIKNEEIKSVSLEEGIRGVLGTKLTDGTIEKLLEEQFEKGLKKALEDLFVSYGDITKMVKDQVKAVMVPYLESYDYSSYILKLDAVLTEVLKHSALENKELLDNFKELMVPGPEKTIKVSEIYEQWMKYVADNVETNGLEVCYDGGDEPTYENVEVTLEVEHAEGRSWSDFENATLYFECEHDEEMNAAIKIHRWKKFDKEYWTIDYDTVHNIQSLRHLNKFELLIMKLRQNYTKLLLDTEVENDEVEPEKKPEPTYE